MSGGFHTEAEAIAFSQAGFSVVSVAEPSLKQALGYAAAYGNFVLAAPKAGRGAMSAAEARHLADRYSCHTNFLGAVVADSGATALAAVAPTATQAMKHYNWLWPIVPNVTCVSTALALAEAGVTPLPAVLLPTVPIGSVNSTAMAWGQATLDLLSELNAAMANHSVQATMAVTINACAYEAESLNRAAAYWSVVFGAQALWWEGVGSCAVVGSPKFKMIAETNKRLSQWAEPLFLKGSSTPAWNAVPRRQNGPKGSTASSDCRHGGNCFSELTRYNVTDVFSTSSLRIPRLQGVEAKKPGTLPTDLIQAMDNELVIIALRNTTVEVANSEAGIEFEFANQRYLLVLSMELSTEKGGASARQVAVHLRADVTSTQPIEPDAFQGFASVPGATANSYNPTPEQVCSLCVCA